MCPAYHVRMLQAAKAAPRDTDLKKKLDECEKEVKRQRFEEALATPVRLHGNQRGLSLGGLSLSSSHPLLHS